MIKKPYLCSRKFEKGTLPEWLGTGLQNRGQRFESARYLNREPPEWAAPVRRITPCKAHYAERD